MTGTDARPADVGLELERLYESASQEIKGWDRAHVRTLIDVGERGLSIDEIAAAYLARA